MTITNLAGKHPAGSSGVPSEFRNHSLGRMDHACTENICRNIGYRTSRDPLLLFHSLQCLFHCLVVRIEIERRAVLFPRLRKSSLRFIQFPEPFPSGRMRREFGMVGDRGQIGIEQRFRLGRILSRQNEEGALIKLQPAVIGIDSFGCSNGLPHFFAVLAVAEIISSLEVNSDSIGIYLEAADY